MPQGQFTDAIALLKADHRKVEDLFAKVCKTSAKDKKWRLAQEICYDLKIHAMIVLEQHDRVGECFLGHGLLL
jgi:hypothetical protein